jgi:hypothetical protein
MTSVLDEGELSTPRPGLFIPRDRIDGIDCVGVWVNPSCNPSGSGEQKIVYEEYSKVSGFVDWNENRKWYSSLTLDAALSLFYESV